ncbi:thioesterase II family protein [Streptomyces sp. NPDC057336]|uniref:thioesterase II family protein n=1 Tax=Streptomyces sp. NPDC057336 TaxID=3346102 RepID=UPI00362BCAFA
MTGTSGDNTWFRTFHPVPDAPVRLVCLPHAGGSAGFYYPLARALAPRAEVLAVQYPGRQDRRAEPPATDLETLADRIAEGLVPWTDRPYALFGHSMGALVAFEAARRLRAAGHGPVELFVSGHHAPEPDAGGTPQPVTDEEVIAEIRALNGTGDTLIDDPETLRMILPALRADYEALSRYRFRPGAPLDCPVTAFAGDDDPKAGVEGVRAWQTRTTGAFELNVFGGGHFFLVDRQAEVLGVLAEHLGRVAAPAVAS